MVVSYYKGTNVSEKAPPPTSNPIHPDTTISNSQ